MRKSWLCHDIRNYKHRKKAGSFLIRNHQPLYKSSIKQSLFIVAIFRTQVSPGSKAGPICTLPPFLKGFIATNAIEMSPSSIDCDLAGNAYYSLWVEVVGKVRPIWTDLAYEITCTASATCFIPLRVDTDTAGICMFHIASICFCEKWLSGLHLTREPKCIGRNLSHTKLKELLD